MPKPSTPLYADFRLIPKLNLICRVFGHHFGARFDHVGDVSKYLGEVCTRCATPAEDKLHHKQPDTVFDAYAVIHLKEGPTIHIAILSLEYSLGRERGMEVNIRGIGI